MWHFKLNINFYFILLVASMGCSAKNHTTINAKGFVISHSANNESVELSTLAISILKKHTNDHSIIQKYSDEKYRDYKRIHFEVNPDLTHDYCITKTSNTLSIIIKSKHSAIWIIHQLTEDLSKFDSRINADELLPSTVNFKKSNCNTFDFNYRDPHYSTNQIEGNSLIFGNNNVDIDWGLWGHNLSKIIPHNADSSIYAMVNGKRNKNQFSFSSSKLIEIFDEYVRNNFGDGSSHGYHFMIMPQDNQLVCTCDDCKKLGNTEQNATPAVSFFIKEMANRFPHHKFFTSAYHTTQEPPKEFLGKNTGVFLSSINLKKGVNLDKNQPETTRFLENLKKWKDLTENIYLWDYSSNFDDYLTPIPVLYSLQEQLKFYNKHGINGIFLNASGYDYSPFDDLKTFVAGELMKNINSNIDTLIEVYLKKQYPKSHSLLADYYISLERDFAALKKPYNMYGGINEILKTYLNPDDFIVFYDKLASKLKQTGFDEIERKKLDKLYTALSFTRLQIAYNHPFKKYGCVEKKKDGISLKPEISHFLVELKNHFHYDNLSKYKEASGNLNDYIHFWEEIIQQKTYQNLLLLEKPIYVLVGNINGVKYLNNGLPAYENDYHHGWHISYTNTKFKCHTEGFNGKKIIELRFLNNNRHGFYPPSQINFTDGEEKIRTISIGNYDTNINSLIVRVELDFTEHTSIEIEFIRRPYSKSMVGCDEIRILNEL